MNFIFGGLDCGFFVVVNGTRMAGVLLICKDFLNTLNALAAESRSIGYILKFVNVFSMT